MEASNREIIINHDSRIIDIQAAFASSFPFLKIDFYETDTHSKSMKSIKIDNNSYLRQLVNMGTSCTIDLNCNRTVSEISQDFLNVLGVIVQISRKSGTVWNVVSVTEGWTLKSQNTAGEFISSLMNLTMPQRDQTIINRQDL